MSRTHWGSLQLPGSALHKVPNIRFSSCSFPWLVCPTSLPGRAFAHSMCQSCLDKTWYSWPSCCFAFFEVVCWRCCLGFSCGLTITESPRSCTWPSLGGRTHVTERGACTRVALDPVYVVCFIPLSFLLYFGVDWEDGFLETCSGIGCPSESFPTRRSIPSRWIPLVTAPTPSPAGTTVGHPHCSSTAGLRPQ